MSNREKRKRFKMPPAESYRAVSVPVMMETLALPCVVKYDQQLRQGATLALILGVDREIERGHIAEIALDAMKMSFYLGQLCSLTGVTFAAENQLFDVETVKLSAKAVEAMATEARDSIVQKMELVVQCPERPEEVN